MVNKSTSIFDDVLEMSNMDKLPFRSLDSDQHVRKAGYSGLSKPLQKQVCLNLRASDSLTASNSIW